MKLKLLIGSFLIYVLPLTCNSQKYSLELATSLQWFTSDFYLNYKAVENPDLKVTYGDGSVKDVVEQYEFSPLWSVIPTFTYKVRNPRNKSVNLEYSIGLGYSRVSYTIMAPKVIAYIPGGFALSSGDARQYDYSFGYLNIPLQLARNFSNPRKPFFASLGLEIANYILLSKSSTERIYGQDKVDELNSGRLETARDYMVSVGFVPQLGFGFGREKDFRISLVGQLGLVPFNVLKKEQADFYEYPPYNGRDIEAYEEATSLNFYYGVGLNVGYEFN